MEYHIGLEVEAYCTKCKLDTIHVITAMDGDNITKVMCQICQGYHKYRSANSSTETPVKVVTTTKRKTKEKKTKVTRVRSNKWTRLLSTVDENEAIEYRMTDNYEVTEAIKHKTFGLGIVKNIISNNKIEVVFHDRVRILGQNWQI